MLPVKGAVFKALNEKAVSFWWMPLGVIHIRERLYTYVPVSLLLCHAVSSSIDDPLIKSICLAARLSIIRQI